MSLDSKEIIQNIIDKGGLGASFVENHYLCIKVNSGHLTKLLKQLRDNSKLRFTILTDLFAADFPEKLHRFEIVYNLLSLENNERIIVKTSLYDGEALPSICNIFSAAEWYEREIFDLFGVEFNGHPDMRRILTDYGFSGHPLRKDFPVTGYVQVRYDSRLEKVINEPVKLQQAFREFDFMSPWQGPNYSLPGDEKANKG
jgi:NADH-quinone oxidoreductase subunit C